MSRVMGDILRDEIGNGVQVYIDDIIIHAKEEKDHDNLVKKVCEKLELNKIRLNVEKVQFKKEKVILLGIEINGKTSIPKKAENLELFKNTRPKTVSDIRSFLGTANWARDYIEHFAHKTLILTSLTKGKQKNRKIEWSEKCEKEYLDLIKELENLKELNLPNYKKSFILKTDASYDAAGGVLMQYDENSELRPIYWFSKKFTAAETKYGITEKEMYAVYLGCNKFAHELKGKHFEVHTDHKALITMREKSFLENDRVNRWINKLSDFDFAIKYIPGEEMGLADSLSRNLGNVDEETIKKLNGLHVRLGHKGFESIKHEVKEIGLDCTNNEIKEMLSRCEICLKYNSQKRDEIKEIIVTKPFEKIGIDTKIIDGKTKAVLIAIDFFSRYIWIKELEEKTEENILKCLKNWFEKENVKMLIHDQGREFTGKKILEWCVSKNIINHTTSHESHTSNGRTERAIRTISSIKNKTENLSWEKVSKIYNETWHRGIKTTPVELIKLKEEEKKDNFQKLNDKSTGFFKDNEVLIANKENRTKKDIDEKGLFNKKGKILYKTPEDSYIVKTELGKIVKKRRWDLKPTTACLEGGS
ncbi:pol [Ecytonucleospora hepatopenaei]|uniref:Pol n=1 Tax=Ecytonucleospora hepatopenaei TaxID=646526 RepID=A0A1W0E2A3_9MICR|nr:pol [Ecytonucleospora hepatopenaei]